MKVYRIVIDINPLYAHIHAQLGQNLSEGIKVMWDDWIAKGNTIPDFVYSAYTICRKEIANDLQKHFKGLKLVELIFEKNPKELISQNRNRLKWLPKENIELIGIDTNIEVPVLPQSTLQFGISGQTGKEYIKEIIGAEALKGNRIIPRELGKGVFFNIEDVGSYNFFKPITFPFLLCTEEVKSYIQKKKYSNIIFLEVGNII